MELLKPLSQAVYPAQTVSFGAVEAHTSEWPNGAQGVVIWSDQPCYVEVGEGAVATSASTPIPAFTPIPFAIPLNANRWRVSALQISSTGTLYCKPVNKQ